MRKNSFKKTVLFFISLFLLLILTYQLRDELKNILYLIFSPFQKFFLKINQNILICLETISETKNLKKENEELKKEIQKLVVERENLKELERENQAMREALGIGLKKEFELRMVKFLGKDVGEDVLLIDKGERDGLKEGEVVILPEKILIGKIIKVYQNFSKVKAFTFKDFSFDVKIPEREITALSKGEGNFKAKIQLIPKEKEIFAGDKVFTSALGRNFPEGILVGEIEEVKDSDISGFKEAKLKPYFGLKTLDYLFVILNF
jgi:rod shape-determining protein MreC